MGNSPLVTYTLLSPNCTKPRRKAIDTVTIHCFVGQVTAKRGCEIFQNTKKKASSNYIVGYDGSIGLCVEEKDRAWTTGGKYTVNGMTGSQNDQRAITIEVACEPTHPYRVTPKAYAALLDLLVDICRRNPGIGRLRWKGDKSLVGKPAQQNMTVHRWFAPKACPGDYLYNLHDEIAAEVNRRLDATENKKNEEEIDMEEVKKLLEKWKKEIEEATTPKTYNTLAEIRREAPWAEATVCKLIAKGAIQGTTGAVDEEGNPAGLALTMDLLRNLVINDRAGIYGE